MSLSKTCSHNLADRLRERIRREGLMTFRDWMQAALYDEKDGYYQRPDMIRQGRAGDYRTAPETSPLFAATFAHYFTKSYFDLGAPGQWTIVEVGAGTGMFARGVLSTLQSNFANVFTATHYLIDEVGPDARRQARDNLAQFKDRVEFRSLCEIAEPIDCGMIFSNELIDAFPVHRVIGRDQKLRELCVGLNDSADFVWIESDLTTGVAEYCERIKLQLTEGQIHEVNLEAESFVSRAAALLREGLLITVDYGAPRNELLTSPHRFDGTLRAFRRHQLTASALANPGEQDLTTTVDWTQIQAAGARNGLENLRLERLDQFLLNEGLFEALAEIAKVMTDTVELLRVQTSAREMILPNALAASFQVLIQRKNV
jgi:SAM-dependent MidA family methyltransferase